MEARSRDASARQQLAELKRAYAALAAREADTEARATQGAAREAALRDALARSPSSRGSRRRRWWTRRRPPSGPRPRGMRQ